MQDSLLYHAWQWSAEAYPRRGHEVQSSGADPDLTRTPDAFPVHFVGHVGILLATYETRGG